MFCINKNGKFIECHGNVLFSDNVYQPAETLSAEQLTEFSVYELREIEKGDISINQKYGIPVYTVVSPTLVEKSYPIEDKTEQELQEALVHEAANIRRLRDSYLASSDWTQVMDSPVDRSVWAVYRQDLRDIPSQPGFPWHIDWPVLPL